MGNKNLGSSFHEYLSDLIRDLPIMGEMIMNEEQRLKILGNDLSDLKVGDWVFSVAHGFSEVSEIGSCNDYPIMILFSDDSFRTFDNNGRYDDDDKYPTIFQSKESMLLYFQTVEEEKPKKAVEVESTIVYYKGRDGEIMSSCYDKHEETSVLSVIDSLKNQGRWLKTVKHVEQIELDV